MKNVKALSPIWLNEKKRDIDKMKNKRIKRINEKCLGNVPEAQRKMKHTHAMQT